MKAGMLAVALAGTLALPAAAAEGAPIFDTEVGVLLGATDPLRAQGDRDPIAGLPARAAYFRTRGDVARSDKWAQTCIDHAAVKAEPGSQALYKCLGILAGNQLWRGEIAQWAQTMQKVRRLGNSEPALRSSALFQEASVASTPYDAFLQWPTASVARRPKGVVEIPVRYAAKWPVVSAVLSGGSDGRKRNVTIEFLVDTGATHSFLAKEAIEALQLKRTEGFDTLVRDGRQSRSALVEPLGLEVGGIALKDVSFVQNDGVALNIIGLDVLRQLGPLLLNNEVLRVLGPAWKYTGCTSPARVLSDPWGRWWNLHSPMKIDGRDKLVFADTGMAGLLEVRSTRDAQPADAPWKEHAAMSIMGRQDRRIRTQAMQVVGSGFNRRIDTTVVEPQPGQKTPETWLMGGQALETHNLLINLETNRMCWSPREDTPA